MFKGKNNIVELRLPKLEKMLDIELSDELKNDLITFLVFIENKYQLYPLMDPSNDEKILFKYFTENWYVKKGERYKTNNLLLVCSLNRNSLLINYDDRNTFSSKKKKSYLFTEFHFLINEIIGFFNIVYHKNINFSGDKSVTVESRKLPDITHSNSHTQNKYENWVKGIPEIKPKPALFLNGVYENVLEEITKAQRYNSDLICYLQPYKAHVIKLLEEDEPLENRSINLYISLTTSLHLVGYVAQIVGWEDKRKLINNTERLIFLNKHIKDHQPKEEEIYFYSDDEKTKQCVNLLAIKNLKKITNPFSVKNLIKISDNTSYKPRTQAGGWSYVFEVPNWVEIENSAFLEKFESDLDKKLSVCKLSSSEIRKKRISKESNKPEEIQIISRGFKRNPDVIIEVLLRANGKCEHCHSNAPFLRKKDNSPYLEVHHEITLADGGDDTLENAIAVCPNCHKEMHFGV